MVELNNVVNAFDILLREGQERTTKRNASKVKSILMLLLLVVKEKPRFIFVTMVYVNYAAVCLAPSKICLIITRNNILKMNLIN